MYSNTIYSDCSELQAFMWLPCDEWSLGKLRLKKKMLVRYTDGCGVTIQTSLNRILHSKILWQEHSKCKEPRCMYIFV